MNNFIQTTPELPPTRRGQLYDASASFYVVCTLELVAGGLELVVDNLELVACG